MIYTSVIGLSREEPCRMRALIVSDSHGKLMDGYISTLNSSWNVKLLAVGRGTSVVRETYQSKLDELQEFFPDAIRLRRKHQVVL